MHQTGERGTPDDRSINKRSGISVRVFAIMVLTAFLVFTLASISATNSAAGQSRSHRASGNLADDTTQAQPRASAATASLSTSFNLTIHHGWNFITVPVMNPNYTSSTLGLLHGDVITRWDPFHQIFDKTFIMGISPPTLSFPILPSTGYLVWTGTNETLHLVGTVPSSPVSKNATFWSAAGGWESLGFLGFNATRHASDVPAMFSGGGIKTVAIFDVATGTHKSYIVGLPFTDFVIPLGSACWVYCAANGTFSYQPSIPPIASFTTSANRLTVAVNASASFDSDGTIVSYSWNFGDGATATGVTSNHTYATWGTWWITLTLTDDSGSTASTATQVTVSYPVPPDTGFYTVFGYANDSAGNPVFLASVTVTCLDTGAVWSTTTDDVYGYYILDLGTNATGWYVGDTLRVEITKGNLYGVGEGIAAGPGNEAFLWLDIVLYPM